MCNYCIGCGVELSHIDDDPNGESNTTCARCRAEEDFDFDKDPTAEFDRFGQLIERSVTTAPSVCESDKVRLEWCITTLQEVVKLGRDKPLGSEYPNVLMVISTIKRVLQPNLL